MTHADLIITNARILTMDPARPFAQALAVQGNIIQRVGTRDDVMELRGPKTRVHDNGLIFKPTSVMMRFPLLSKPTAPSIRNSNSCTPLAQRRCNSAACP
jgi:hypothetical protein